MTIFILFFNVFVRGLLVRTLQHVANCHSLQYKMSSPIPTVLPSKTEKHWPEVFVGFITNRALLLDYTPVKRTRGHS